MQAQFLPVLLALSHSDVPRFLTNHPLCKLPVFTMGVAAGLLTVRGVQYPASSGTDMTQYCL